MKFVMGEKMRETLIKTYPDPISSIVSFSDYDNTEEDIDLQNQLQ